MSKPGTFRPKETGIAIGIDIGTTYSCVGVCKDEKVEIIPSFEGNKKIPTFLSFGETNYFFGESAKIQEKENIGNVIYDIVRFIGRKYDNSRLQSDFKKWSFRVVEKKDKHEKKKL